MSLVSIVVYSLTALVGVIFLAKQEEVHFDEHKKFIHDFLKAPIEQMVLNDEIVLEVSFEIERNLKYDILVAVDLYKRLTLLFNEWEDNSKVKFIPILTDFHKRITETIKSSS